MRVVRYLAGLVTVGIAFANGCSSSDENSNQSVNKSDSGDVATTGGKGGSTGGSAGSSGTTAGGSSGTTTGGSGGTTTGSGGSTTGDGAATGPLCTTNADCTAPLLCVSGRCGTCVQATCEGHVYQCGDCLDNDNDGLTDMNDPDCLGPCHNAEDTFYGSIPGQAGPSCVIDCYFDQDSGSGNDQCCWDHRCDSLSVAPNYPPEGTSTCAYNQNQTVSCSVGAPKPCSELYATQSATCTSFCGPLTPNGCDCFGCCDLPPYDGNYVWLGSTDSSGNGICDLAHATDPDFCRPCTPVAGCLNTCEHCELCIGETTLPTDCYSTPDAGPPPPPPDGGPCVDQTCAGGGQACNCGEGCPTGFVCSGGCCVCPTPVCPSGIQPCGTSCLPLCPAGYYCNTGCCTQVPA